MCYMLPKIWMGRVQKYWERVIPSNFPVSDSTFSVKFETKEIADAVAKMEDEISTENSIVKDAIPENTVVTNYVGTYNVESEPGKLTLLSPEKVDSENIVAMHYNKESGSWEKVDNIQIIDGYVWGTLESFSPIAIFEYKNDVVLLSELEGIPSGVDILVANGNTINITETEDGKVVASTGFKDVEITNPTYVVGGSVDGSPVEKTNVMIHNVNKSGFIDKIIAGSFFFNLEKSTTVNSVNLTILNCKGVGCATGSSGSVRTNEANINIIDSEIQWIGAGESWNEVFKKDVNKPDCSFASLAWAKKVTGILKNVVISDLFFMSGNTGYFYVDDVKYMISGSKLPYLICGGSNGKTNTSSVEVIDSDINIFQSVNRGKVVSSAAKFNGCKVKNLFVGGDATDSTVTGTTDKIRIDIGTSGEYNIVNGVDNSLPLDFDKSQKIVDAVKVSRSANINIDNNLLGILGAKYSIK